MQKNITFLIMPFFIICMWTQPIAGMNSLEEQPTEVFENITEYLSKNDIKNLRLVSKTCKAGSQDRWNSVTLYITFPDAYGLEQIGPNLFKYTPPKKRTKHNVNYEPCTVTDFNDLPVCPIPGCSNKPEPCYFHAVNRLGFGFGLLFHLLRANKTSNTWQQHCQLAELIRLLHEEGVGPIENTEASRAAKIITQINDSQHPQNLALTESIVQSGQLTKAQKGRIITHFENELEFLSQNEKDMSQRNRRAKQESNARAVEHPTYPERPVLTAQDRLRLFPSNAFMRRPAPAVVDGAPTPELTRPLLTFHSFGPNSYVVPCRQTPTYTYPANFSILDTARDLIAHSPDYFTDDDYSVYSTQDDYLEDDIADLGGLIEISDDEKENFINDVMSSLVAGDASQNLPLLPEGAPLPAAKAESQLHHEGKRGADFQEDELPPKRACLADLQTTP